MLFFGFDPISKKLLINGIALEPDIGSYTNVAIPVVLLEHYQDMFTCNPFSQELSGLWSTKHNSTLLMNIQLDVVQAFHLDISAAVIKFDGNDVSIQRSPHWIAASRVTENANMHHSRGLILFFTY